MKLPLEATIAGGYRFLFSRIVSIIGTLWLPYVVLFGACALLLYFVLPHGVFHGDFSQVSAATLINPQVQAVRVLFTLLAWLVAAMVMVRLMQHALGKKETTTLVYFSLAAPVWRMLVAFFLGIVIIVLCIMVLVIAGVAAGFGAAHFLAKGPAVGAGFLLGAVAFCFVVYLLTRLLFFLPAVVVAEEKIGLGRSWELGKGNILRIVAVWLCIAIPIWIVMAIILGATVVPFILTEVSHLPAKPTPDDVRHLVWTALRFIPIILPAGIAAGIAFRGYMAGAIATAYKAVTAP